MKKLCTVHADRICSNSTNYYSRRKQHIHPAITLVEREKPVSPDNRSCVPTLAGHIHGIKVAPALRISPLDHTNPAKYAMSQTIPAPRVTSTSVLTDIYFLPGGVHAGGIGLSISQSLSCVCETAGFLEEALVPIPNDCDAPLRPLLGW